MRRGVLAGLLSLALFAPAHSVAEVYPQSWNPVVLQQFGGLDLLHDSSQLAPSDAQDAVNVLTDSGYLEKRPGNVLLSTILSGYKVQYVGEWVGPSGGRYLIAQASSTIYQTNFAAAPIALSTIATNYSINTLAAYSKLFFADGLNPVWQWNETSTATVTDSVSGVAAPVCTYLAFKDDRTFCANIPTEGTSRVRVSSAGGVGYWVVPGNFASVDNVPYVLDITANDGDYITCLAATPWGVFVGKRYSSYMIQGTGNLTYTLRTLDPHIGCVDNRSVQTVYGVLKWLGVDGVYNYDGKGPPVIASRELDPLMRRARSSTFAQGQWATQIAADWASGTTSTTPASLPAAPWDYTSVPGSVFPTSYTLHDDNTNPATSSPYVGFSSDTLTTIDTTTFSGASDIGGLVQIQTSSSGIQVYVSSFIAGAYTTLQTTWTAYNGTVTACQSMGWPAGTIPADCVASGTNNSTVYNLTPSSAIADSNGWNFGHWSVGWMPVAYVGAEGKLYIGAGGAVGTHGLEFDFFMNRADATTKSGYALESEVITDNGTSPSVFSIDLARYNLGTRTVIGSGQVTIPVTVNSFGGFSTFSVTKAGGYFTVWNGTTTLYTAYDSTFASQNQAITTNIVLKNYAQGGTQSSNTYFRVDHRGYPTIGTIVSRIFDTGMRVPTAGVLSATYTLTGAAGTNQLAFYVRSSTSPNNDLWTAYSASSNNVVNSLPNRYWQYRAVFNTSVASTTPRLSELSIVAISTGIYFSKVNFIGTAITSWRQFNISEATPSTYRFFIRAATIPFTAASSTPAWTQQTVNQDITISTGAYVQFFIDSRAITNGSSAEPVLAAFVRWNEGTSIPVASATLDRRYFLCVAIATATLVPDTCLIQQKNGRWVYWDGPDVASMGLYNYNIVAGDGSTGSKVWYIMQPGVYSDDAAAIDARWVTPDYTNGVVFNDKIFHEAWVDALPVLTSSMTASYMTDKSGTWNDTEFYLDNAESVNPAFYPVNGLYGSLNKWLPPASGYDKGKYFRFKFSNADAGAYFRVNSALFFFETESRTVP